MTLFEIDRKYRELLDVFYDIVDPDTGLIIDEGSLEELDRLEGNRTEKFEAIALYIIELQKMAELHKEEARKQTEKAKHKLAKAERLKKYMISIGYGEKLETTKVKIGWSKSTHVEIPGWDGKEFSGECALPEMYRIQKVTYQPNKVEITKDLKAGAEIPGAVLVTEQTVRLS
jgi:hypothetical protein